MNGQAEVSQVVGASAVSLLKRKLWETNRRLADVLRQRENLSGTCQSRGEYIEQLTSQADALRSQNTLYESAIREKDSQYRQACEQIDWLAVQAEEAGKAHNCLEQEKESALSQMAEQRFAHETVLQEQSNHILSLEGELSESLKSQRQLQLDLESKQVFAERQSQEAGQWQRRFCELGEEFASLQALHQQAVQEKESLLAQLDRTTQRLDSVAAELDVVLDKYRQAQETIRQLQHQSRQAPKPDASVLNAQEVISRFREGFVFERNRTRCAGQGAARVEGEPESAQDQGNEPAGGKVKSLQYQLAILGGAGPEQA